MQTGTKNGRLFAHQVSTLVRKMPLQTKVAFSARLSILRNNWNEQRTFADFAAYLSIPRIAASQLALIEPDFDAGSAQGFANFQRRFRVLRRITQKDRALRPRHLPESMALTSIVLIDPSVTKTLGLLFPSPKNAGDRNSKQRLECTSSASL